MDKQKQIDEMAKILQRLYNCYGEFNAVWFAEHLAVNNIGKIPENAVVLTGTQTEERLDDLLIKFDEMSFYPATLMPNAEECAREWKEKLIYAIGQLVNEKVGKFAEKVKRKMQERDYMCVKYKQGVFTDSDIDEICKEITESK